MHQNTTNRPTAVGARHVKECARASPIPRDCNRTAACASSREAGRELGACTAGPTHPPLGLPASSPPVHRTVKTVTVNVLGMHMPAATCRSRVGLEPPQPSQLEPSWAWAA